MEELFTSRNVQFEINAYTNHNVEVGEDFNEEDEELEVVNLV